MLNERPGNCVFPGNGDTHPVHTPKYDFNDAALPLGVRYWVTLAQRELDGRA